MRRIVLLTAYPDSVCCEVAAIFDGLATVDVVRTAQELSEAGFDSDDTTLLSFGSGIIVSPSLLSRLTHPAYNLHPASAEFPGRDPHHHAIYRGAKEYGATLHVMTRKVDDGPIVAVELFPVQLGDTPTDLFRKATDAGIALLRRTKAILINAAEPPFLDVHWGAIKTRRTDFLALCRLTPDLSAQELERRIRAFDHPGYENLGLIFHGRRFILDRTS